MNDIIIRPYAPRDRDGVRKICADTAYSHYTVKQKLRECMCNMYVDYYLDEEPENVFVAVGGDGYVCGYIVASTDAEKFIYKQKSVYTPIIRNKVFYLGWFNAICARVSHDLDGKFGGGFHINVATDRQGGGIGPALLTAMALHLKKKGVKNMYLVTRSRKTRGYGFYSHYGFREVKRYFLGSRALVFDLEKAGEKKSACLDGKFTVEGVF